MEGQEVLDIYERVSSLSGSVLGVCELYKIRNVHVTCIPAEQLKRKNVNNNILL